MPESLIKSLEKIINLVLKGTIVLLPLFFLPWTGEYFEFNKQYLLWLLMPLALILWFFNEAIKRQIKLKINLLNLPVLIFLLLTLASAWFSLDRFSSFFGLLGRFSDSSLGLISLIIFYFLIINTELADSTEKIIGLLKLFFYSAAAAASIFLLAFFGRLAPYLGGWPSFFSSAWFNPAGASPSALGMVLAIIAIGLVNFLVNSSFKKIGRIVSVAVLAVFSVTLFFINFYLSWVLLGLGSVLMIFFRWFRGGISFKEKFNYYLLAPVFLLLVASAMLIRPDINLSKILSGQELPKETRLGFGHAVTITGEAIKKNPALGSGPGTFTYDFSLYRPAELNQSAQWPIRFDQSCSNILERLATTGMLTVLSYFLIISLIIYLNIILLKRRFGLEPEELSDKDYNLITGLFTLFILIFISQLFFFTNTVLNFAFWFCFALIIAFWQSHNQVLFTEKIIVLNKTVSFYGLSWLVLVILSAGWIMLAVFEVKFFAADVLAASQFNRQANLSKAIELNPYRYNYRLSLAKLYLSQATAQSLAPIEQRNNLGIEANVTKAVDLARRAEALAPFSVVAEETTGMIYRDISPLTIGSETWAVKSFLSALQLEPTNPVLATELAKAYVNNKEPVNAEKYFQIALGLKSDYYDAEFGLAKTYLSLKKDNQALELLNDLASQVPNAEVYYELGRYYYNHGEIDKAIDRFNLVLSISPNHSNSLYSLGIAYESQGKTDEALKYYQKVLELNPGNMEIEKKIKELGK